MAVADDLVDVTVDDVAQLVVDVADEYYCYYYYWQVPVAGQTAEVEKSQQQHEKVVLE